MLGKVVSTALTMAVADTIAQEGLSEKGVDWGRTMRYASAGTVSLVPMFTAWYAYIDRRFDRRRWLLKLGLECVTVGPLYLAMLIGNEELLRTHDLQAAVRAINTKWAKLYTESLKIVPIYQAINFALVPSHLRIYWLNSCQLLWNVYASRIVHKPKLTL